MRAPTVGAAHGVPPAVRDLRSHPEFERVVNRGHSNCACDFATDGRSQVAHTLRVATVCRGDLWSPVYCHHTFIWEGTL